MINTFTYQRMMFIVVENAMEHTSQKFFKAFLKNVIVLSWLSKPTHKIYEKLKEYFMNKNKLALLLGWLSEQNESTIEWLYWFLVDGDDYLLPFIIGKSRWSDIKLSVIEEYSLKAERAASELDKLIKEFKDGKK